MRLCYTLPVIWRRGVLLLVLAALVATGAPLAKWLTLYAVVTDVMDGNNIKVRDGKGVVHLVRLSAVDAPELRQPGGLEARALVRKLVLKKNVRIEHHYFDHKGRILGKLYIKDVCLNRRLLEDGLAWFLDPDGDAPEFESCAAKARDKKVGIWRGSTPVPPWHWRRGRFSYREGMEDELPKSFPRSPSSNDRVIIGVRTP